MHWHGLPLVTSAHCRAHVAAVVAADRAFENPLAVIADGGQTHCNRRCAAIRTRASGNHALAGQVGLRQTCHRHGGCRTSIRIAANLVDAVSQHANLACITHLSILQLLHRYRVCRCLAVCHIGDAVTAHIHRRARLHGQVVANALTAIGRYRTAEGRVIHHIDLQLIARKRNSRVATINHIQSRVDGRDSGGIAIGLQVPACAA